VDRNKGESYVSGKLGIQTFVLGRTNPLLSAVSGLKKFKTDLVPGVVARARYEPLCCLLYSLLTEHHHLTHEPCVIIMYKEKLPKKDIRVYR
jgi:hypothetical protein